MDISLQKISDTRNKAQQDLNYIEILVENIKRKQTFNG